jgi:hypothetical protein
MLADKRAGGGGGGGFQQQQQTVVFYTFFFLGLHAGSVLYKFTALPVVLDLLGLGT